MTKADAGFVAFVAFATCGLLWLIFLHEPDYRQQARYTEQRWVVECLDTGAAIREAYDPEKGQTMWCIRGGEVIGKRAKRY